MPFNFGPGELIILLILAMPLVIFAVIARQVLIRDRSAGSWGPPPPDPRAVLAERLARGEITPEEFDTAMRALGYGGPGR